MRPKAKVTASTVHTRRLDSSAQSSVLTSVVTRISVPPMVGVPALGRCVFGPSSRTTWPIWYCDRRAIIAGPTMSESPSPEAVARMARKVRYEKTCSPLRRGAKSCVSQYSISALRRRRCR